MIAETNLIMRQRYQTNLKYQFCFSYRKWLTPFSSQLLTIVSGRG